MSDGTRADRGERRPGLGGAPGAAPRVTAPRVIAEGWR